MSPRLIVSDIETGGFDEKLNPITEIALLAVDASTLKVIDEYVTYIKPYNGLIIEKSAIIATQVDLDKIEAGQNFVKVVLDMINFFRKHNVKSKGLVKPIIVGHNFRFDMRFIEYLFRLVKDRNIYDHIDTNRFDTMDLMMLKIANMPKATSEVSRLTLAACCEMMGITLKSAHGAKTDATATLKLLSGLTGLIRNNVDALVKDTQPEQKTRDFFQF